MLVIPALCVMTVPNAWRSKRHAGKPALRYIDPNPIENKGGHDMISPDAYLADSEQAIFSMLRVRYNMPPDGFVQENGALPEATLLVSQRALARLSTANSNASNAAPPHGDL